METAYIIRNGVIIGSGSSSSVNPDASSTYIINCTVAMESDGTVIVENYDGDFTKTQQTIADGGKVELRTNFNSSNYILEPSRIEEDYVTFNTIDKNANITIKVTEYGINDVSYIDLNSGGGGGAVIDDIPTENSDNVVKSGGVFEALEGKQDCVTGGVSGQFLRKVNNSEPSRFEWVSHSNFVITGEVAFDEGGFIRGVSLNETYSLAKYAINKGQAVLCSLQDKNDSDTWYHLSLVRVSTNKIEFEGHLRKEDSIDTVYFSMDSNENYIGKRYTTEYMPKVTGTYGQIIGFDENGNCIAKEEGEATKPYVVKMYYTLTDNQFQAIPASRTAKWSDWYPFYEAGGEVILELHKDSVDSGDDIIRLYAHSKGIYNKTYNTLEVQFTSIGETTTYATSDHTKYLYVCWWQSGNSCKVNRYKINEIPTGGTTGQILAKKSDTNYDAQWINLPSKEDTLVVTAEYSEDDNGEWTVSNVNKTFTEIDTALDNGQNVILKIYPEGTTENPYLLYPAMHYKGMGVAFSVMVSDTDQISGLNVMIMTDGSIMASRNAYEFGKITRIKTIEIPSDRIHKDYTGDTSTKVGLTKINDYVKRLSFYIEETFFTENNIDTSKLLNIYLQASGQQGGALMTTNPYGTSDIFSPGRSGIAGTDGVRYIPFNLIVFGLNGNSGDSSTEFTVTGCKIRYEE